MPKKLSRSRRRHLLSVVNSYAFMMTMEIAARQRRHRIRPRAVPVRATVAPGIYLFTKAGVVQWTGGAA